MMKYEVVIPWHGVKKGDVIERAKLHPALIANVRQLAGQAELVPATPPKQRGRPPVSKD